MSYERSSIRLRVTFHYVPDTIKYKVFKTDANGCFVFFEGKNVNLMLTHAYNVV